MVRASFVSKITRLMMVVIAASSLLGAATISNARSAVAQPALNIWSAPAVSFVDDGTNQVIAIKAILETGNFVDIIRIIVDEGTPAEKVYEFEANGDLVSTDAGFMDVDCSATFLSDGYAIAESVIRCFLALDKSTFELGLRTTKVELVLDTGTFSDTNKFKLFAGPKTLADLVNKKFTAPSSVERGDTRSTFTTEANEGNRGVKGHWVKIYLSSDETLDEGDKVVGKKFVPFIGEGKTKVLDIDVTIPDSYPLGSEFFISMIDPENLEGEQDETNNDRTKATTLTT